MNLKKIEFGIRRRIRERVDGIKTWNRRKIEKACDLIFIARRLKEKRNQATLLSAITLNEPDFFDRKMAFGKIEIKNNAYLEKLYAFANHQKQKINSGYLKKGNNKEYLQKIFDISMINRESMFMVDGILSAEFIARIAKYFDDKMPILHDVSIFYSPPSKKNVKYEGSQLFHRDGEGTRNLKIWILCEDTLDEDGPTTLLDGESSEQIAKQLNYVPGSKISDFLVESTLAYKNAKHLKGTGDKGSAFYTDTCRSFHYGSRTDKETSRLVAMYHFVDNNSTYWLPYIGKTFRGQMKPLSDELRALALQNNSLGIILEKRLSIN